MESPHTKRKTTFEREFRRTSANRRSRWIRGTALNNAHPRPPVGLRSRSVVGRGRARAGCNPRVIGCSYLPLRVRSASATRRRTFHAVLVLYPYSAYVMSMHPTQVTRLSTVGQFVRGKQPVSYRSRRPRSSKVSRRTTRRACPLRTNTTAGRGTLL